MLEFIKKSPQTTEFHRSVTLPWEKRIKSRQRVTLDDGSNGGIFLPRGTILRGGDILLTESGEAVLILAAPEEVSTVVTPSHLLLCRICYHLGNRHVALEIQEGAASYLHDHVLDDMVVQLGGKIRLEEKPFEPEHGAYSGHSHGGGHGHSHG